MTSWETLIIQLGVAGAVLLLGYKLALVLINKWSEGDKARTEAHTTAERERTATIATGFAQITSSHGQSHSQIMTLVQDIQVSLERLDARVATVMDLTPVHGTRIPKPPAASTPISEEKPEKTTTPVAGVKIPPRSITSG